MAFNFSETDELTESHDINVTPFIDVMLVLLIIFMVAAPLATVDVPVTLPSASQKATPQPDKPVFISVKADGGVAVGDDAVSVADLGRKLTQATGGDHEQRLFLRADKTVSYEKLMQVMDTLRSSDFLKVGLVAEQADKP